MLKFSESVENSRSNLVDSFKSEALRLAAACDKVYIDAFHQSFPREQQDLFGLTMVAVGSYGRQEQIFGVSDSDVALYCNAFDYDKCFDTSITDPYVESFNRFQSLIQAGLQDKKINPETYPERVPKTATHSDLKQFWQGYAETLVEGDNYTAYFRGDRQQAFFIGLSTILSSRILIGRPGFDPFDSVKELILEPGNLNKLKTYTVKYLNSLIGEYGTLATVKNNIKVRLQKSAQLGSTLIKVLEIAASNGSEIVVPESIKRVGRNLDDCNLRLSLLRRAHQAAAVKIHGRSGRPAEAFLFTDRQAFNEMFSEIYGSKDLNPLQWLYQTVETLDFNLKRLISFVTEGDCQVDTFAGIELARDPFSVTNYTANTIRSHLALDPSFLPVYQSLRGITDRHAYQTFTNFEHGLKTAEYSDRLARGEDTDDRFVKIFASLNSNQRRIQYFVDLFHDCAKKNELESNISDPYWHAEKGAEIAVKVAEEIGFTVEEQRVIQQLIANHLMFKDVSKFSIHTIHRVLADLPADMRNVDFINQLVLLTYADSRSTEPEAWSSLRANHLYKTANSAHLLVAGRESLESAESFTDQLIETYRFTRIREAERTRIVDFLRKLPDDFRELPRESICDFINLYDHYQDRPVVALIPHNLETDIIDPSFKVDLLIVTKDQRFLASNIVHQISDAVFEIQSADFFTNTEGTVFNRLTFFHKNDRSDNLAGLQARIEKCLLNEPLQIPDIKGLDKLSADNVDIQLINPRHPPSETTFMLKVKTDNSKWLLLRLLSGFNRVGLALTSCSITTEAEKVEDIFELSLNGRQTSAGVSLEVQQQMLGEIRQELLS